MRSSQRGNLFGFKRKEKAIITLMYLIVVAPTEVIFKQTFGIFWISADAYGIM